MLDLAGFFYYKASRCLLLMQVSKVTKCYVTMSFYKKMVQGPASGTWHLTLLAVQVSFKGNDFATLGIAFGTQN